MPIRSFVIFATAYLACAMALARFFHPHGQQIGQEILFRLNGFVTVLGIALPILFWGGLIWIVLDRSRWSGGYLLAVMGGLVGSCLFALGFTITKNVLPFILPYWADAPLAFLDRALHFGIDPYTVTAMVADYVPAQIVTPVYLTVWGPIALLMPLWLVMFDRDQARIARYLKLYGIVFVGLGNVMALAFMSAGPVYYDRMLGGEEFAHVTQGLVDSGLAQSGVGMLQQGLWDIWSGDLLAVGSGISAFPSVHVAMAALLAVYVTERLPWIWPLAAVFVGVYLFLSVYTGFHYAIDGYVAIVSVLLGAKLLRLFEPLRTTTPRPVKSSFEPPASSRLMP